MQNTIEKKQINKNDAMKFDAGDNKSWKYKIKIICNSAVYKKESKSDHLLKLN